MNVLRRVVLASLGGLITPGGAQAADLPMSEPVQYAKVCDAYGRGFFYIPGTETCLDLGGVVRAEAIYVEPFSAEETKTQFHARARASFDARTATEYGVLRSYIRLQFDRESGCAGPGSGFGAPCLAPDRPADDDMPFDYALIQFGGVTVGYTDSMFDFKPYPSYAGMLISDIQTLLFAYTAQFGEGWSVTLAAEDGTYRRTGGIFAPYVGQDMPDFVANLRVEQGWGSAQLSAAIHQIDTIPLFGGPMGDEYGWAAQGGILVNLPMIADGDFVYASGAYAIGALSYLISGAGVGLQGTNYVFNGIPVRDFVYEFAGGIELTEGFNVNAGFEHHWSPNWRSSVSASYADIRYPGDSELDWAMVEVAGQTVWSPVPDLDIGVEVDYSRLTEALQESGFANPDNWSGRLRVERSF